MTAQPTDSGAGAMWSPDPVRQRMANYTIEDVLSLPDDAPRVELLDGVMLVVPSPTHGHQKIGHRLWRWFDDHAPRGYEASGATGVAIGFGKSLEPDLTLLRTELELPNHHYFDVDDVVLVVEIVSPGTKRRDRLEKPAVYAAAGIRYFWRIEQDPVHVFAYELVDGEYKLMAETTGELILERPFDIRLPIRDIAP
jgi:Uma2 family endonuclease